MNLQATDPPIVAAFDFDGTITYRDTLLHFLIYTHGFFPTCGKLFFKLPSFIAFLLGKKSRQKTKEGVIRAFYAGLPIEKIRQKGESFAKHSLEKHIRPEAKERLRWHLQKGHRCVLNSASLDVYLVPWAKKIGFHDVISSQLETDKQGHITGNLCGLNCWGPEKTKRLIELLGPKEGFILYAYGDSKGDQELLAIADHSYYREMPQPAAVEEG